MAKEPLKESSRFKVFLSSIILELLILVTGWASANFGWEIPPELLEKVALTIGGLVVTFIASRTYRNAPS